MNTKQEIINEYLLGHYSYRKLAAKHGIGCTTLHRWIQGFQGLSPAKGIEENSFISPVMAPNEKIEPPEKILELERQLAQEKLRNKLLTAMIDIAEQKLKIPIRKKYGTKQLKK